MTKTQAPLIEVFPSIQGEGMQVGCMQLFIRFAGCNLSCRTCDTKKAWEAGKHFILFPWPGRRSKHIDNSITPAALYELIDSEYPLHEFHSISLTGGEPLVHATFVRVFSELCRRNGLKIFLETNGTLFAEALQTSEFIDFWSVDLKLSKTWGIKERPIEKHKRFLKAVPPEKSYLKLVIDATDDLSETAELLEQIDTHSYSAVIQPFSANAASLGEWDSRLILEWLQALKPYFAELRWIPQVHKLLRIP